MSDPVTRSGTLYVIATPIGNLADLSPRAVEVLGSVDRLLVEDTRVTGRLLLRHGVKQSMLSLTEHNESTQVAKIMGWLEQGAQIGLVSDAGTPLISDPGFRLVTAARDAAYRVVPIPGPSALVAALSVSGLPTDKFRFEGFLPPKAGQRIARLKTLCNETSTLVFYEAPHRVPGSLTDMAHCLGADRMAMVARELTKLHEECVRAPLASLALQFSSRQQCKGEFVIVVQGARHTGKSEAEHAVLDQTLRVLLELLSPAQAAAVAAQLTGARRNEAYRLALSLVGTIRNVSAPGDSPDEPND